MQLDVGTLDLRSLDTPPVRIDRLEDIVVKLSVSGRPRPLLAILAQSITALNATIARWNKLIEDYKARPGPVDAAKVAYLFGLPQGGGVDTTFGDTVQALYRQTDDCIFFQ